MSEAIVSSAVSGNLPAEPNSFVGRERDLADLALLLADVRLLTLSGPGGIGKTRLAIRLACQLASGYPDGTWLAELADVQDRELVPLSVAAALGIRAEPDRPVTETLTDALMPRRLLLVLDTCEHQIAPVAELARRLLAGCPAVRILATSREPLRVAGETVWRVPPLDLPPPPGREALAVDEVTPHEAVRLFCDRAIAVRPTFVIKPENAAAVSRLCRTLDGVPLAIELAAARLRALSVEQVAARIDDRFRLLASGDRAAPPRQQTLRAAVDWSHGLLTEPEQILLRRLAVFSGWDLDAAERVCADDTIRRGNVLDLLAALIDKSLVTLDGEVGAMARYRLLDTIREYALGSLTESGEETGVRLRHLDYMLGQALDMMDRPFRRGELRWAEQVALFHRHAADLPNYRLALGTALQHDRVSDGLRICSALRAPWVVFGDAAEGSAWFDRFLQPAAEVRPDLLARALTLTAELAFEQQDYAKAESTARRALDICDSRAVTGRAGGLRLLGLIKLRAGLAADALADVQTAIDAARAEADEWEEGLALTARATILARLGRPGEAQQAYEVSLDVLADNNGWGVAHALVGFGSLAMAAGDNEAALRRFRTALGMFLQIDARPEMARCLAGIGRVQLAAGDIADAADSLGKSLQLSRTTGQRLGMARGLGAIAALAAASGNQPMAARLEGAASALRDVARQSGSANGQLSRQQLLATSRAASGEPAAARLFADGAALSPDQAVALALSVTAALVAANGWAAATAAAARSSGSAGSPTPLTAREHEIAMLIARGMSNRAIADELVISPATAARHVANILSKLGFSSRAQVAAWIAERVPGSGG
jgi:predicted ATPase/DNA-binding NarL/FixJ family response regulator